MSSYRKRSGPPAATPSVMERKKEDRPKEVFIFARFHARDGQENALREAIQEEIQQARSDIGCLAINAYASVHNGRLFFIHSRWVDSAAFDAHAETPHTVRFIQQAETLIDHPLDVNRAWVFQLPVRTGGESC